MTDDRHHREDPPAPLVVARVECVRDFAAVVLSVRVHTRPIGASILRAEKKQR